ncbi:MAG TPA: HAD family hydrolase [Bdellovibrionota bacterium]|nr:HAD family hydrolase [Bdellovibrionota bacterium]
MRRYRALACDYDGTIAPEGGRVDPGTLQALKKVQRSGRKLLLVTGRRISELVSIFPALAVFDCIVAENGAVLYNPKAGEQTMLAPPPPAGFVETLRARGVDPIWVGSAIVATVVPHDSIVHSVIRDLKLELRVFMNKGGVMVLPPGVNKVSGLNAALKRYGLQPEQVIGVGDAENDEAFLLACGYSVAVANALQAIKQRVDLVTKCPHGGGIVELVDRIVDIPAKPATISTHEHKYSE